MDTTKSTAHISVPKGRDPEKIPGFQFVDNTNPGFVSDSPQAEKDFPRSTDIAADSDSLKETELVDTKNESNVKLLPYSLQKLFRLILGQDNRAYAVFNDKDNAYALAVGSRQLDLRIRRHMQSQGDRPKKSELIQINDDLKAEAELAGEVTEIFHRVAPVTDGIEIDIGDEQHKRVRIVAGKVEILKNELQKSEAIFWRSDHSKALTLPAERGDFELLAKYVNISEVNFMLFVMYLTYVIAHPKIKTTAYPIMALLGGQGSGKTWICKLISRLVDPSVIGMQVLPGNPKDLAIAAQISHILFYDNLRAISQKMADALCVAATGGSITSRELYSDASLSILRLHVALVLNGIHEFMTESDLAQRCIPIRLNPIQEVKRKSEAEMENHLTEDLPLIIRGLYDCIAEIFLQLPNAQVTNPERMIGFVEWIAAYEKVKGVRSGIFQGVYSDALNQAQLDSLLEHPLPAALIGFTEDRKEPWSGEPTKLLEELSYQVSHGIQRTSQWPSNAIAFSKRLRSFEAALRAQGIYIEFGRGKNRSISVRTDNMEEEY